MVLHGNASDGSSDGFEPFGDPSPLGDDFVQELLAREDRRGRYDEKLAYALAVMSAWSYADARNFEDKLQVNGFPGCSVEEASVVNPALFVVAHAYVVRSACGRLAFVVFRGTEPINLASWLTDADVITRALPERWNAKGTVHRGFLANLEAVWDGVQIGLAKAHALEAVYVTGHSLGGAMAVLAAARLLTMTTYAPLLEGVYTYGQPAVGDADFAKWAADGFGEMLYRHVYNHDLVPQLPPTTSGTFQHFGAELHSKTRAEKELWEAATTPLAPVRFVLWAALGALLEFAARRTTLFRGLPFPNSIGDHSPAFYIATSRNTLLRSLAGSTTTAR